MTWLDPFPELTLGRKTYVPGRTILPYPLRKLIYARRGGHELRISFFALLCTMILLTSTVLSFGGVSFGSQERIEVQDQVNSSMKWKVLTVMLCGPRR